MTYVDARTTTVARAGADDASWQEFLYDGLGRLVREIRQMPGGYAVRTHAFDPAGHETFDSEWKACVSVAASGDCATGSATLGTRPSQLRSLRPGAIGDEGRRRRTTVSLHRRRDALLRHAQGDHDVERRLRLERRLLQRGSLRDERRTGSTRSGRVVTALEPGGDITTYAYDVAGKLVSVTQGSQVRTFAYDALGYLLRETTPEAGTVDYTVIAGGSTYSNRGSLGTRGAAWTAFGAAAP